MCRHIYALVFHQMQKEVDNYLFSRTFQYYFFTLCFCGNGLHRYISAVFASFLKFYQSIGKCKQGKIFTYAYIFTGMINGTSLTYKDITGYGRLTTKYFYTEPFAL